MSPVWKLTDKQNDKFKKYKTNSIHQVSLKYLFNFNVDVINVRIVLFYFQSNDSIF